MSDSEDDAPNFSSPDVSSDGTDYDSDNVFNMAGLKFQKNKKTTEQNNSFTSKKTSPTRPNSSRLKRKLTVDERLSVLDRSQKIETDKRKARLDNCKKRLSLSDDDDSDDDSSEIEIFEVRKPLLNANGTNVNGKKEKSSIPSNKHPSDIVFPVQKASVTQSSSPARRVTRSMRNKGVALQTTDVTTTRSKRRKRGKKAQTKDQSKPQSPSSDLIVDLLSDSSDEETPGKTSLIALASVAGARKDILESLQRSRMAQLSLKSAQKYHAEDIHVDVPEEKSPVKSRQQHIPAGAYATTGVSESSSFAFGAGVDGRSSNLASKKAPPPKKLGKRIKLKCRIQLEFNGEKKPLKEHILPIREHEELQVLCDKILKSRQEDEDKQDTNLIIPPSARVIINFDGMTLSASRTPSSYDIEDEDLLDVAIRALVCPNNKKSSSTKKNKTNLGPRMSLKLRRQDGHEAELKHHLRESFQVLLDAYHMHARNVRKHQIVFRFDGEKIDLTKSPLDYDMETGDLIDVVLP